MGGACGGRQQNISAQQAAATVLQAVLGSEHSSAHDMLQHGMRPTLRHAGAPDMKQTHLT